MPRLSATNTLYVLRFHGTVTLADRVVTALALLTSSTRSTLARSKRLYADGLPKLEPRDLSAVAIPTARVEEDIARRYYSDAITSLLSGDETGATEMADGFFSRYS